MVDLRLVHRERCEAILVLGEAPNDDRPDVLEDVGGDPAAEGRITMAGRGPGPSTRCGILPGSGLRRGPCGCPSG